MMSKSPPIGAAELRPLDHRVICCDNDLEALGQLERGPTGGGEIYCDRPRLLDKSGGSHARHIVHLRMYFSQSWFSESGFTQAFDT